MRIGITGIDGFLGWHLRCFLRNHADLQITGAGIETFAEEKKLLRFVESSDTIVHFAGMNRGDEKELVATNIKLTDDLISACETANRTPHVIFSSSTQIFLDNAYGNSKKACAERLQRWSDRSGAAFTNMILPNVFGECGKPYYNSVTATFCYQLAIDEKPHIINDNTIELIHAQAVAYEIYKLIKEPACGEVKFTGRPITVSDLLVKLLDFKNTYKQQIAPDLSNDFDLQLFNTYRSYLFPKHYPVKITTLKDDRGDLFETVKTQSGGKCFVSNTNPGFTRGNHYHLTKFERFLVLEGRALICLRKLFSEEVVKFEVDGACPAYIDIPTLHTHNITNTGKGNLLTLFWSNKIQADVNIDTFYENV